MKKIVLLIAVGCFVGVHGQVTNQTTNTTSNVNTGVFGSPSNSLGLIGADEGTLIINPTDLIKIEGFGSARDFRRRIWRNPAAFGALSLVASHWAHLDEFAVHAGRRFREIFVLKSAFFIACWLDQKRHFPIFWWIMGTVNYQWKQLRQKKMYIKHNFHSLDYQWKDNPCVVIADDITLPFRTMRMSGNHPINYARLLLLPKPLSIGIIKAFLFRLPKVALIPWKACSAWQPSTRRWWSPCRRWRRRCWPRRGRRPCCGRWSSSARPRSSRRRHRRSEKAKSNDL